MAEGEAKGLVKWFSELGHDDIKVAGGKGASLAEMYNEKIPVPPGFVVTAQAYSYFLDSVGLKEKIKGVLDELDVNDTEALNDASEEIRGMIDSAEFPEDLKEAIREAYEVLDVGKQDLSAAKGTALDILKTSHESPFVAVRSSATAEDLADASFAGQQESFLNVKGDKDLLGKVKKCFSSLFTPRAIFYREKKGFKHEETELAVVVQKMVDSDKSGVIFSNNPIKKDDSILIEAVFGLGEGIVSGKINPDNYVVSSDLEKFKIGESKVSDKKIAITRDSSGENVTVKLTDDRSKQQVLTNHEIKVLAQYAQQLEKHYKKPQDIEFAVEGEEIYIVQSRPVTTQFKEAESVDLKGEVLVSGFGASPGIASGKVRIVHNLEELSKVKAGDILVTKMTNPDMVVTMQKSAGIVTDDGGVTSHAAIVSREMGIPAIVGTGEATGKLEDGEVITVDGNSGKVFEGHSETQKAEIKKIVEDTKTKIKTIVDLPDFATRAAESGAKCIGLVRLEGIIAANGKHPLFYVKQVDTESYIEVLSKGLKRISEPFEEIWIRTSDIRSDEFRHLQGATKEVEGNPMLGDHGIRFGLKHKEILESELKAIKEIADDFPDKRFGFMVPQLISVDELKKVKALASEVGLPSNVKTGVMIETPASVQIINEICEEGVDFISFGTNDLTQYILAIDRNNSDVQEIFDEMNPAVLSALSYVIRRCKRYNVETSICGQAGSKKEMVEFLVGEKIDSISVNADAAYDVSVLVKELERKKGEQPIIEEKPVVNKEEAEIIDRREDDMGEKVEEDIPENPERVEDEVVPEEKVQVPMAVSDTAEQSSAVPKTSENQMEVSGIVEQEVSNEGEQTEGHHEEILTTRKEYEDTTDVEDVALRELENGNGSSMDYNAGDSNGDKQDIPSLNEAIPVDSSDFEAAEEEVIEESLSSDGFPVAKIGDVGAQEDGSGSDTAEQSSGDLTGSEDDGEVSGDESGGEDPSEDDGDFLINKNGNMENIFDESKEVDSKEDQTESEGDKDEGEAEVRDADIDGLIESLDEDEGSEGEKQENTGGKEQNSKEKGFNVDDLESY